MILSLTDCSFLVLQSEHTKVFPGYFNSGIHDHNHIISAKTVCDLVNVICSTFCVIC